MDEWLDSFDPATYRELLASESLDPDPMERLIATIQLGFSVLTSMVGSAASGKECSIPPSAFDPMSAKTDGRGRPSSKDTVQCGPNQMARLMSGMVALI